MCRGYLARKWVFISLYVLLHMGYSHIPLQSTLLGSLRPLSFYVPFVPQCISFYDSLESLYFWVSLVRTNVKVSDPECTLGWRSSCSNQPPWWSETTGWASVNVSVAFVCMFILMLQNIPPCFIKPGVFNILRKSNRSDVQVIIFIAAQKKEHHYYYSIIIHVENTMMKCAAGKWDHFN